MSGLAALGAFCDEPENTVLLAAYLKQAIILYGHHQDLKNGPAVLDKAADFINSLGHPVQWLGLSDIYSIRPSG